MQVGGAFGAFMLVACTLMLFVFLGGMVVCAILGAFASCLCCLAGCIVCVATCLWLARDGK